MYVTPMCEGCRTAYVGPDMKILGNKCKFAKCTDRASEIRPRCALQEQALHMGPNCMGLKQVIRPHETRHNVGLHESATQLTEVEK